MKLIESQYYLDLDFFICFNKKQICHFASNATMLPAVMHDLDEELYFETIEKIRNLELDNSDDLFFLHVLEGNGNPVDFVNMAKRGIHSYDKVKSQQKQDLSYRLIASTCINKKGLVESVLGEYGIIHCDEEFSKNNLLNISELNLYLIE